LAGETEVLGENLPQRHFCPPQIPHDQTLFWTPAVAVGSRRLTAWAMARPSARTYKQLLSNPFLLTICVRYFLPSYTTSRR
jgi:hypothetical protein